MLFTAPVQIKIENVFFPVLIEKNGKGGRNSKPWSINVFIPFAQREREKTKGLRAGFQEAETVCMGQGQMV